MKRKDYTYLLGDGDDDDDEGMGCLFFKKKFSFEVRQSHLWRTYIEDFPLKQCQRKIQPSSSRQEK